MVDFSHATLEQLLGSIDENFYYYATNPMEFENFIACIFVKACLSMDVYVNRNQVNVAYLPKTNYGVYDQKKKTMTFNRKMIEMYDLCKMYRITYLPFRLAQTALHEARHYAQFNKSPCVDELLIRFTKICRIYENLINKYDIDYNTNPIEVDARNYAFSVLSKCPNLQKFIVNSRYSKIEKKISVGCSSIYSLYMKIRSAMFWYSGEKPEYALKALEDLGKSSIKFLQENNLNPEKFGNTILQYKIRLEDIKGLRYSQKEQELLKQVFEEFDKTYLDMIFNDENVTEEELLKCRDRIFSLNAKPERLQEVYYHIRLRTEQASETRALYKHYAPEHVKLLESDTPPQTKEENNFWGIYNVKYQ